MFFETPHCQGNHHHLAMQVLSQPLPARAAPRPSRPSHSPSVLLRHQSLQGASRRPSGVQYTRIVPPDSPSANEGATHPMERETSRRVLPSLALSALWAPASRVYRNTPSSVVSARGGVLPAQRATVDDLEPLPCTTPRLATLPESPGRSTRSEASFSEGVPDAPSSTDAPGGGHAPEVAGISGSRDTRLVTSLSVSEAASGPVGVSRLGSSRAHGATEGMPAAAREVAHDGSVTPRKPHTSWVVWDRGALADSEGVAASGLAALHEAGSTWRSVSHKAQEALPRSESAETSEDLEHQVGCMHEKGCGGGRFCIVGVKWPHLCEAY